MTEVLMMILPFAVGFAMMAREGMLAGVVYTALYIVLVSAFINLL
jgi:hypothetical protein